MLVKFFAHGNTPRGAVSYLLSDKDHTATLRKVDPEVKRGDAETTQEIINQAHRKFKKCYTSGVLSFAEPNLLEEQKNEIMKGFEKALLPSLDRNEYNILWVEHRDKDRLELHFIVPRMHLPTKCHLQPYFAPADQKRINAWQGLTNDKLQLADPKEPVRQQAQKKPPHNLPKNVKEIRLSLEAYVLAAEPENRQETIELLNEIDGVEVVLSKKTGAPRSNKSLSIKVPEIAKNIKIEIEECREDYRKDSTSESRIIEAQQRFNADREKRIAENERIFRKGCEISGGRNREKYDRYAENLRIKRAERENRQLEPAIGEFRAVANTDNSAVAVHPRVATTREERAVIEPVQSKIKEIFNNDNAERKRATEARKQGAERQNRLIDSIVSKANQRDRNAHKPLPKPIEQVGNTGNKVGEQSQSDIIRGDAEKFVISARNFSEQLHSANANASELDRSQKYSSGGDDESKKLLFDAGRKVERIIRNRREIEKDNGAVAKWFGNHVQQLGDFATVASKYIERAEKSVDRIRNKVADFLAKKSEQVTPLSFFGAKKVALMQEVAEKMKASRIRDAEPEAAPEAAPKKDDYDDTPSPF